MNFTKIDINQLIEQTRGKIITWERSDDQECCSTFSSNSRMGFILCLFNKSQRDEFIVFEELNEFGYYNDQARRYFPNDDIYFSLKSLVEVVDQNVKIVDLQP